MRGETARGAVELTRVYHEEKEGIPPEKWDRREGEHTQATGRRTKGPDG